MGKDEQKLTKKYLPISAKKCLHLDAYIRIEEWKDKQGQGQSRFILFNLDQQLLDGILQAKAEKLRLEISEGLLTELRSYALVDGESRLQSGLTFCTAYRFELGRKRVPSAAEEIILRSVISLDGEIINQIRRDSLQDGTWCLAIATAHHWLISQLLYQLRIQAREVPHRVAWGLALFIVALIAILCIGLAIAHPWLWIIFAGLVWLLQFWGHRLLNQFVPWIYLQLLWQMRSPYPIVRKIVREILTQLVYSDTTEKN